MTPRRLLGDAGERYAERLLSDRGWRIIDRKWRGRRGELDLIALDGEMLVVIEVKTRRGSWYGSDEEAVSPSKATRLVDLATKYIASHPGYADHL
jgi:putative endonuclease